MNETHFSELTYRDGSYSLDNHIKFFNVLHREEIQIRTVQATILRVALTVKDATFGTTYKEKKSHSRIEQNK